MAKKRTKSDKQKASRHRLYHLSLPNELVKVQTGSVLTIKKDLTKTIGLVVFIIGIEFFLYFYTR